MNKALATHLTRILEEGWLGINRNDSTLSTGGLATPLKGNRVAIQEKRGRRQVKLCWRHPYYTLFIESGSTAYAAVTDKNIYTSFAVISPNERNLIGSLERRGISDPSCAATGVCCATRGSGARLLPS